MQNPKSSEYQDGPPPPGHPLGQRLAAIAARLAVGLVFAWNLQCALAFIVFPDAALGAYELSGASGAAAIQGIGIAFLMWNATYPPVIISPPRHRALFAVILAQQAIGLAGESWILLELPDGHQALAASIVRFIAFDAAGLVLMAAAFIALSATHRRGRA